MTTTLPSLVSVSFAVVSSSSSTTEKFLASPQLWQTVVSVCCFGSLNPEEEEEEGLSGPVAGGAAGVSVKKVPSTMLLGLIWRFGSVDVGDVGGSLSDMAASGLAYLAVVVVDVVVVVLGVVVVVVVVAVVFVVVVVVVFVVVVFVVAVGVVVIVTVVVVGRLLLVVVERLRLKVAAVVALCGGGVRVEPIGFVLSVSQFSFPLNSSTFDAIVDISSSSVSSSRLRAGTLLRHESIHVRTLLRKLQFRHLTPSTNLSYLKIQTLYFFL
jgi:hypothetical protein